MAYLLNVRLGIEGLFIPDSQKALCCGLEPLYSTGSAQEDGKMGKMSGYD